MVSSFGILTLLLALLNSGANDLLDYADTNTYWEARNVAVSVEAMANELKPAKAADAAGVMNDLGSPEAEVHEAASKKLRAMGPAVLAQLRETSKGGNPAVAGAAKAVIEEIEADARPASIRRLMAIRYSNP